MNDNNSYLEEIKNLNSEDSEVRRSTASSYLYTKLPDELIRPFVALIDDQEAGVRDIVSSVLSSDGNPAIPNNLVPYVSSENLFTRNLAGEILIKIGKPAINAMMGYLADGNDDDKKFLIDVMGLIGDPEPISGIIETLEKSNNDNVLLACIEALGNIRADKTVDYLIDSFDKNENFRPTVIEALGKIGSQKALDFILNNYIYVDELTKFSMLESIGLIGDEQAFFLVLTDLKNITGPMTWAAIEALKKLRDKLNIDVPYDESMKNAILSTLVDAEPRFQKAAAGLISVYQDSEIVDAILKIFGSDPEIDDEIKVRFFENPAFFYSKIASYLKQKPSNIKPLIEIIKEMIQNDGGESIFKMNELELRTLGDVFADNLTNSDEEIRRSVMELIFFISIETAFLFLDTMSIDDNIWNRLRLLEILESLNDERIISTLVKLSEDPEEMVAEKAREIANEKGVFNLEKKV